MPDTQTLIVGGGTDETWKRIGWSDKTERRHRVKKYMEKYRRGGPYADAIDSYPLFTLSSGWELQCEEGMETLKDKVQEYLDQEWVDMDADMWQGILSAILGGDGYQEIVWNKGGEVWGLVSRDPSTFRKNIDQYGRVIGYTQFVGDNIMERGKDIDPNVLINLILFRVPGDVYGQSIWERADDDIQRDCDIIESVTKSIHRHGTPKILWNIGSPENRASADDTKDFSYEVEKMNAMTDFVSTDDVRATMLDTSGVSNVDTYSNTSLQRVACALGVPEEMLGLGRGSTEATATVRLKTFYDKITTIQQVVSRTYSRKLLDKITGVPGSVWIEFNDVSPEDEKNIATWISMLRTGIDPDAVCDAAWAREKLGIPPDEAPEVPDIPEDPFPLPEESDEKTPIELPIGG